MKHALGRHILCEAYGCDPEVLNDRQVVEQIMVDAALLAGAEVREVAFHKFSPQGVSGVWSSPSRTWPFTPGPSWGTQAIDVFTCGSTVDPWEACNYLIKMFRAPRWRRRRSLGVSRPGLHCRGMWRRMRRRKGGTVRFV